MINHSEESHELNLKACPNPKEWLGKKLHIFKLNVPRPILSMLKNLPSFKKKFRTVGHCAE
jgi:hypothetical protein